MPEIPKSKTKENILFVCAHSDDHIFGAGGTIAKYTLERKHVHAIILSYGEKTHPWLKPHITKTMRAKETVNADDIVGCSSTFFNLREGKYMEDYPAMKNEMLKIVKREKPSKVFTHTTEDPHPDHKTSNAIALDLINSANIKPEIYMFSIWNPFSLQKSKLPRMYVDITKTRPKKIEAMKRFKSQWAALAILFGSIISREVKNGFHIGTKFAESFYRLK